jgi:hypothetical protein
MNCTEPVACHGVPTPLIGPRYLESSLGSGAGVHTAKDQRVRISQGKEGHEFRSNLVSQGTLRSA